MVKKVIKIVGNSFMIIIILIIAISLYSMLQYRRNPDKVPTVFGYSTLTVLSGSMRPYLEPGDMIVDKAMNADEIKIGDVLTYKDNGSIVTHRVTEVISEKGNLLFATKGDANNIEDNRPINSGEVIGRVLFKIPYGGYVARFIRSPVGLVIFIVIPIALMLISELMKVILFGGGRGKDEKKESQDSVHID